jgi:hypothetical protein
LTPPALTIDDPTGHQKIPNVTTTYNSFDRENIGALTARIEFLQCLAVSLGPREILTQGSGHDKELQDTLDQLHKASSALLLLKEELQLHPPLCQELEEASTAMTRNMCLPPGLPVSPLATWLSGTQGHLLEKQLPDSFRVAALNCRSLFGSTSYALGARSFGSALGEYMNNIEADILCVSDLAMATGRMKSALMGLGEHSVHGYFRGLGRGKGVGIFIQRRLQSQNEVQNGVMLNC